MGNRRGAQRLLGVDGLAGPFGLEVVPRDDLVDVCVGGRRTLLDRCPGARGDGVRVYGLDSAVTVDVVEAVGLA